MNAPTEANPEKEIADPSTPRNRTWSVEVTYVDGGSDRETVKCVAREEAYRLVTEIEGIPMLRIEGEGALVLAQIRDVRKIRVSKGA